MNDKQRTSNVLGSSLLAAALCLVLIGERVLGQGGARDFATALGGLLFLGATGWRLGAWRKAQGDARAVEARLLLSYAGIALALGLYALSTDACMAALKLPDEARTRSVGVLSVLWPSVLLVSTSALFFMELAYARMPITASVELRRVRTAAYAGLTLAFSTVFLLSINYIATARDVRRDVSYFKTTVPSAGTQSVLNKLDTPVKALLFWRKTDDVLVQVEPYFATLAKQSKKLSYQVIDAALAPEISRKNKISGNGFVLLLQGEGDKQKAESFRIGNELTEARSSLKKLDSIFQQHFGKLTRPSRSVQLTVGHAERNAKNADTEKADGTLFMEQIFKRLSLKTDEIGLAQGLGSSVPEGASAVIVAGPREKLMPEEAAALLAYVHKGGRLLLMIDPDADDGLAPLLAGLGIERKPGTLVSEKDHMEHAHDASDKAIVYSNSYSAHPSVSTASRYQSEVATIFVRGAALDKVATQAPAGGKLNVSFPLRTSPKFFRDLNGNYARETNEPEESLNMLAAVSFAGAAARGVAATEGRALVIGDGDFMTDKVASNNGNMMVFVDALSWLIGNEELSAEVSSEEDQPLIHTRDEDKLWFYATTFAVPLPVLGLGMWVARRRRKRSEASS